MWLNKSVAIINVMLKILDITSLFPNMSFSNKNVAIIIASV